MRDAARKEVQALANMVRPTPANSYRRKLIITAVIAVWVAFEVLLLYARTNNVSVRPPESLWWVRLFAMYQAGRLHGREREKLDVHRGGF